MCPKPKGRPVRLHWDGWRSRQEKVFEEGRSVRLWREAEMAWHLQKEYIKDGK
jgi:hypothetical protein